MDYTRTLFPHLIAAGIVDETYTLTVHHSPPPSWARVDTPTCRGNITHVSTSCNWLTSGHDSETVTFGQLRDSGLIWCNCTSWVSQYRQLDALPAGDVKALAWATVPCGNADTPIGVAQHRGWLFSPKRPAAIRHAGLRDHIDQLVETRAAAAATLPHSAAYRAEAADLITAAYRRLPRRGRPERSRMMKRLRADDALRHAVEQWEDTPDDTAAAAVWDAAHAHQVWAAQRVDVPNVDVFGLATFWSPQAPRIVRLPAVIAGSYPEDSVLAYLTDQALDSDSVVTAADMLSPTDDAFLDLVHGLQDADT